MLKKILLLFLTCLILLSFRSFGSEKIDQQEETKALKKIYLLKQKTLILNKARCLVKYNLPHESLFNIRKWGLLSNVKDIFQEQNKSYFLFLGKLFLILSRSSYNKIENLSASFYHYQIAKILSYGLGDEMEISFKQFKIFSLSLKWNILLPIDGLKEIASQNFRKYEEHIFEMD